MMVKALVCSTRILEKVMGPPLRGLVHSAFSSAANLSFADGSLLSVNALSNHPIPQKKKEEEGLLLPNGLLLSAGAGDFPFDRLEPGMPVLLGTGWLLFEAIGCSLDFMSCARWDPRISRPAELDVASVRARARWLADLWHGEGLGGTRELEPRAGESIFALAERLCGRGPGLTPGGDDFLVGWLAVAWLLNGPHPDSLAVGQYIVKLAHTRTHPLSRCWLTYAAAGDVAQPVGELLEALTTGERDRLERAARRVLALGATSGAELLRGILYSLTQGTVRVPYSHKIGTSPGDENRPLALY